MATQNPFADFTKLWGEFKAPQLQGFDFNKAISSSRRNAEALTQASQTLAESAQVIARRQAELARNHVETVLKTAKDLLVNGSPEINTTKQVELTKTVFESSLNNLREMYEMVAKSGLEAMDVINKRASESLQEFGASANASATASTKSKKSA